MLDIKQYYKVMEFMYDGEFINGWDGGNKMIIDHQLYFIKDEFEKIIYKITKNRVNLTCAARTDKGVHAMYNICNFKIYSNISNERLIKAINYYLPKFIRIINIMDTHIFFSSRFWSLSRRYEYLISNEEFINPLLINKVWNINYKININNMIIAQKLLLNMYNVKGFVLKSFNGNLKRTVIDIEYKVKNIFNLKVHSFEFEAKSFAHHQIRIIMYFLIQVGIGKYTIEDFSNIINCNVEFQKILASPYGLYLKNIKFININL